MEANQEHVVKTLMTMAVQYKHTFTEDAADLLIQDLKDFSPKELLGALKLCRLEMNRFPTVAEIVLRLGNGEKSQTQQLIGKIYQAIHLHGYTWPERAREFVGEQAWKGIQYFGGWKKVCDFPSDNDMALRAQLRSAIEASIVEDNRSSLLGLSFPSNETIAAPLNKVAPKELIFNVGSFK